MVQGATFFTYAIVNAFSSDGRRIVTASADKTARVWDGENGAAIAELVGHKDPVRSAVFSPDGRRIVAPLINAYHFVLSWDAP
ncbi:MAG: hypothetical protein H5U12_04615 [Hoeflea sp.]|nr:hypothetical protein [Hoeflea sp.]